MSELDLWRALQQANYKLQQIKKVVDGEWGASDAVYRFYTGSFKVFWVQGLTREIVGALHEVVPDRAMHPYFLDVTAAGTNQKFIEHSNGNWLTETRPIIEALAHAAIMLDAACRCGASPTFPDAFYRVEWALLRQLYQVWDEE